MPMLGSSNTHAWCTRGAPATLLPFLDAHSPLRSLKMPTQPDFFASLENERDGDHTRLKYIKGVGWKSTLTTLHNELRRVTGAWQVHPDNSAASCFHSFIFACPLSLSFAIDHSHCLLPVNILVLLSGCEPSLLA